MIKSHVFQPILTSLLFSFSFVAAKYTTIDLQPLTTSLLRYIVAFLFLLAITATKKTDLSILKKDIPLFIGAGLLGIVGYHYFFFLALRYTVVANTAIINASNPIITGFLAAIFIRERLKLINYIGVFVSVAGVIILLIKGRISNLMTLNFAYGDLLMILAVVSWAIYAIIVKRLVQKYSGLCVTFYAIVFGVMLLFPLALSESVLEQLHHISLTSVLSVVYMGIGASGVGYLFYNNSIRSIGPTKTSTIVYSLVPIFVAMLAFLFFGEPITWMMTLSGLLIVAGLNLMLRYSE